MAAGTGFARLSPPKPAAGTSTGLRIFCAGWVPVTWVEPALTRNPWLVWNLHVV